MDYKQLSELHENLRNTHSQLMKSEASIDWELASALALAIFQTELALRRLAVTW